MIADDAPTLPILDQCPHIIGTRWAGHAGTDESPPDIENIRFVHQQVVRVGIRCPQVTHGQAGSLQRDVRCVAGEHGVGACGHRDIRVAGRVNHNIGEYYTAAPRRCDNNTFNLLPIDKCTASKYTEPNITSLIPNVTAEPLHFIFDGERVVRERHFSSEPHELAVVGLANQTECADSSQSFLILNHQDGYPLTGGCDGCRGAGGSTANHNHVISPKHLQLGGFRDDLPGVVVHGT